jgi:hypothetical protein
MRKTVLCAAVAVSLAVPTTAQAWGTPDIEIHGDCNVVYSNNKDHTTPVRIQVRSDDSPMGDFVIQGGPQTFSISDLVPPGLHTVRVIASNANANERTVEDTFEGLKCHELPTVTPDVPSHKAKAHRQHVKRHRARLRRDIQRHHTTSHRSPRNPG